jgi:hypothetical protein
MAQLLYDRHSTKIHLSIVKRHKRLCKQIPGAEELIIAVDPFYDDLLKKQATTLIAEENKEVAYDNVQLNDRNLDDRVRSAFEKCKQYDRDNPGRPVLNQVFPDGKFSTIVNTPLKDEPDEVAKLVARIEALGTEHVLNELVAYLNEGIDKCRQALNTYYEAIKAQKSKEAEEAISKSNLSRQYEFNYLDAVKKFGKNFANRLFPVINNSTRSTVDNNNEENTTTNQNNDAEG